MNNINKKIVLLILGVVVSGVCFAQFDIRPYIDPSYPSEGQDIIVTVPTDTCHTVKENPQGLTHDLSIDSEDLILDVSIGNAFSFCIPAPLILIFHEVNIGGLPAGNYHLKTYSVNSATIFPVGPNDYRFILLPPGDLSVGLFPEVVPVFSGLGLIIAVLVFVLAACVVFSKNHLLES